MILNLTFAALAVLSLMLTLWQWMVARRFPLHQRAPEHAFPPAVTLLKALKGSETATEECLRSWFTQEYTGRVQILFGVACGEDPVCEIVGQLLREFPAADAQLIVCGPLPGANAKVSKLAELEGLAKHDVLIISDADVLVPPDFLANIVALLREPVSPPRARTQPGTGGTGNAAVEPSGARQDDLLSPKGGEGGATAPVGLVTCFYRLANPVTLAMQWEAVAINADFWSQVLQSQSLKPLDFALGAVMATWRKELAEIGGFAAIRDCLADDYQLGNRIARNGHRIVISPVVAECWSAPMDWAAVWKHQLRWARTIRVCQPAPYFFSILSNATLWPLLWLVAEPGWLSLSFCAGCCLTRVATALHLQSRLRRGPRDKVQPTVLPSEAPQERAGENKTAAPAGAHSDFVIIHPSFPWWLPPVKDLLQAVIWLLAFTGNRIEWRGQQMRLRRDGTLVRI